MHQDRTPRRLHPRIDPRDVMSDRDFKHLFCFSQITVTKIAKAFEQELSHPTKRGTPPKWVIKVSIALAIYGGRHYQRVAALCGGMCQFTAHNALKEVTNALL